MNTRRLAPLLPYLALLLAFAGWLDYWSHVAAECPQFCNRGYDDFAYFDDFQKLLSGGWPGGAFYQSPVPGYFLGLTHRIYAHPVENLAIPYLIQIFAAVLTAAMTCRLAARFFSRRAGVLAVLLLAAYPFTVFYATTIEANTLTAFFITAALFFTARYPATRNRFNLLAGGMFLGLAALGRSSNLLLPAAVLPWLYWNHPPRRSFAADAVLLLGIMALVTAPAVIHSSAAAGRFTPITFSGVYNITMGNLPDSPGFYWDQAVPNIAPVLDFVSTNPAGWLLLQARKFQLFFTFPWTPAYLNGLPPLLAGLWLVATALTVLVFVRTFTRQRSLLHLPLLVYAGVIILAHVEDEYRIPILPLLAIFAAVTLLWVADGMRRLTSALRTQRAKIAFWAATGLLAMAGFISALIPAAQTTRRVHFLEGGPVHSGARVWQFFTVDCPNLHQIEVDFYALAPDQPVKFWLNADAADDPTLFSTELDSSDFLQPGYHRINFPAISDSAGRTFVFYFDTAGLSPETGLMFFGGPTPFSDGLNRVWPGLLNPGNAYVSVGALEGNLAFAARCDVSVAERLALGLKNVANLAQE